MGNNALDLRGKTLSESKEECLMFFNRCIMDNKDYCYVLHGHGTGVLKEGLREVRMRNFYV
ncbi:unnamed protein product, partial [Choristocarpus tenellus]